jgi:hypothetical protein
MNRGIRFSTLLLLILTFTFAVAALAQRRWAPDRVVDRRGVPEWQIDPEFSRDVFTFVRIRYNSRGRWRSWAIDYPDAELNLSFRLQQMTSMKVDPDGLVLELTDPRLFDYPFIYIVEPGDLVFSESEVQALRRYLSNGGFLMVDDFWGVAEWRNFYREIKRVFPDREPIELPLEHPVFNIIFPLEKKPQVPHMDFAVRNRHSGITWERPDAREPGYWGIFDDKDRMMVIICHNTDLADGWEREGDNHWYFLEFSEKQAYPMAINILFYAMTH